MKIAVAGASGAIGRKLVPLLLEEGHEVIGLTRSESRAIELRRMGARTVNVDAFDRDAVFNAFRDIRPDSVIHQLTSLSARDFKEHSRLRKVGTRNLVDAALAVGVRKMIAQSISWAYLPGDGPATEEHPLDLEASPPRNSMVEAVHSLETAVAEMPEYIVLRYGLFYGPGTWYAPGDYIAEQVRLRQLPATDGVSSFVHLDDAALAAVNALNWPSGVYNIVDSEPASGKEWLPVYAKLLGAPEPVIQSDRLGWERGAKNGKALEHGWKPRFSSWREGFLEALK